MGEKYFYQPLTRRDVVTVLIYRAGIALSTLIISAGAVMLLAGGGISFNVMLIALYASVALGVFFIHLYVSKFHRALKRLYYISLAALVALFIMGRGDALAGFSRSFGPVLLIPLSGCLGFITAKEAFCFKLIEGYLIALLMPFLLFLYAAGVLKEASYALLSIALLLVVFTLRKVFQPIHYDIGDKSAYH